MQRNLTHGLSEYQVSSKLRGIHKVITHLCLNLESNGQVGTVEQAF